VFLSSLSTQNSIHLAIYLYTNSKQDNSTFKCEGGWRHTAGGWRLAVASGGWAVTAGGCKWWLPSLTF
jgi:hypothetical protein